MTELETLKFLLSYAPNVAIAIGVAKIYVKVTEFIKKIETKVDQNSRDIQNLIDIHIDRHEEDAKILLKRKSDG